MGLPKYNSTIQSCPRILLLFLISSSVVAAPAKALWPTSAATDRLALLAFKSLITSDPTGILSSWGNQSLPLCQWPGVTCAGRLHSDRVAALDLSFANLTGTLSPHLSNLTFLTMLQLWSNNLVGPIPSDIGRLSRLKTLNLSLNHLNGEIPSSLTRCSNLMVISLKGNLLTGEIPRDIGALSRLQLLRLSSNNLTGTIPPSFNNLSSIQRLSLSNNRLVGSLPPDILDAFPALQFFDLSINQLSGRIPVSLTNASNMYSIQLGKNFFTGKIPSNLGKLRYLRYMQFASNQLEASETDGWDFLTSLANCTQLEYLILTDNRLRGILPASVGNLSSNLHWLFIEGNQIFGSIPDGIGNLVNLTQLGLTQNRLSGVIPSTIGRLQQLGWLSLSKNQLTGQIPNSIGNLKQLSELYLNSNNLNGTIPPSLGNLKNLQKLDLSQNGLTGSIPKELLTLSSLTMYLDLSHNLLTGSLPSEVGKLTNLNALIISNNKLSDAIPSNLGSCQSLQVLDMHGNLFQGTIPLSLSNLKGLEELDLSSNNLSGVPAFLGTLHGLFYLNLSFNSLQGQVPNQGVFRNTSGVSLLGNNLCGGDPKLHLPLCDSRPSNNTDHHTMIQVVVLVLAIALGLIIILVVLAVYCKMKKIRKKTPFTPIESQYQKVSYPELLKSTDGFSASNLLGVGSFGSVYKGTMASSDSIVAVKVLNLQQRGATKSFLAECKALKAIRHRNLLKILTVCSSVDFKGNDFRALVLEFMPNGSLEKWLHPEASEKSTLSLVQRLNIAIDVASALEYLHHHGQTPIVHCDLKPSNVLLDNDMCAYVGDFGLARFLSESTDESQIISTGIISTGIKGTVGYVPPEYGMGGQASTSGDAYSYGILLLELFTGKRPTDDVFTSLSLRNYVEIAFPERVVEIIHSSALIGG